MAKAITGIFCFDTVTYSQQPTETAPAVRTQEEELIESLRAEFHETACKIQSLQAETESLRTLVRQERAVFSSGVIIHVQDGQIHTWI